MDIDLDLIAKVSAIGAKPRIEVAISDKGVYCLKCLQDHYPRTWTVMDNGTWYCEKHKKLLT